VNWDGAAGYLLLLTMLSVSTVMCGWIGRERWVDGPVFRAMRRWGTVASAVCLAVLLVVAVLS